MPIKNKILHIPRRFTKNEWGGTETAIFNLLQHQKQLGSDVEIHTTKALDSTPTEIFRGDILIRRYNYTYPFLCLPTNVRNNFDKKGGNLLSLHHFSSMLKEKDVRLYHAHTGKRLGGSVMTAAHINGKPFVITLHGGFFDIHEDVQGNFDKNLKSAKLEWGKIFGLFFQSRKLLERADAVICINKKEFEIAKKMLSHNRIYFLGHGVSPDQFSQSNGALFKKQFDIPQKSKLIGCIGRYDEQKNQLELVEAFNQVAAKDDTVHLLLAGPTTNIEYYNKIKELVEKSPFQSRIRLLGSLDPFTSQLKNAYDAIDILAVPSIHEPFGIVALEGWLSKCSLVTSNTGGLDDLVNDERDGLKYNIGDLSKLVSHLTRLLTEPELAKELVANGYKKVLTDFSWEAVAIRTESIYQSAESYFYSNKEELCPKLEIS